MKATKQKLHRKKKTRKMFNEDLRGFEGFKINNGPRREARDLCNGEGGESDSMDETDELRQIKQVISNLLGLAYLH